MPRRAKGLAGEDGAGKRYPLNMRTTRELRDTLTAAASQSGRSLAQEVEHRLEESLRGTSYFELVFNSSLGQELSAIAHVVRGIEKYTGRTATTDAFTAVAVRAALDWMIRDMLTRNIPIAGVEAMSRAERERAAAKGEMLARVINVFASEPDETQRMSEGLTAPSRGDGKGHGS